MHVREVCLCPREGFSSCCHQAWACVCLSAPAQWALITWAWTSGPWVRCAAYVSHVMARVSARVCAHACPDPKWHAKGTTRLVSLRLAETETGPKARGEANLQAEQPSRQGDAVPNSPDMAGGVQRTARIGKPWRDFTGP